ncbi:diaminopimelate decarboxylase [Blastopirellula sp. J2-11]|uniref:diaminopimelate decarboxylase n=1 Tax=Blastopirellula sp. J2-11 TaxID=2943192 RepID=UPI0021C5E07A|nr:diaminopimelate decarboxylase [Blastopirellula sp. J2-11]UUO05808.1 diaminopimelate decarboxylase [Blastopirellula sp. J2-11]
MPTVPQFKTFRTEIAGVSVLDLAAKYGTPTFVYDAAKIVERIEDLRAFDVIRYAQKACSNLAILNLMRKNGVMVDAVSAWEIRRALAAGYGTQGEPAPLVYTADIFDHEALALCVEHGLHVNCGSPDMIAQLGEAAPGSEITLRINPGFGHGHSQKTNTGGQQSKHGIWHEQLNDCLLIADQHGVRVTGLHMHIGSGTDLEHLAQVCGSMEKAAIEVGRTITTISAGGGLPIPYNASQTYVDLDQYFELWNGVRNRLQDSFGHAISLEIEPGRYLSAESGFLLAEIRAIKTMGENKFYVVDAGFNNLARPILYGSYHPMSIALASGETDERPHLDVVVGGPLCESGDIFTQEEGGFVGTRSLPAASIGDFLVIECAGAYGFVMGSNYNSKPLAAEVLIQDGQTHLIRERQTFENLIAGEHIPGVA